METCIGIVTIALVTHYHFLMTPHQKQQDFSRSYICLFSTGGFLLLNCYIIFGYMVDDTFGKALKQELAANILGCILNIIGGSCIIEVLVYTLNTDYERVGLGYGLLTLINGILYGVDAYLTFKQKRASETPKDASTTAT